MKLRLKWEKQSWKRYLAYVGPLWIEVSLVGIDPDKFWTVNVIFGAPHFHACPEGTTLEQAQETAERLARQDLIAANTAMLLAYDQ